MIRKPIHIVTDAMLRANGGQFELMGGAVRRVSYSTEGAALAAGDDLIGGALTPVYFVTAAQLATQRFKLAGDHGPNSGETYLYAGNANRGVKGHVAIPVYDPGFYRTKVLSYNPIAYWMLAEAAGPTALCEVLPAQNGTHVGVTLAQPGIGDGNTCPFYDGANDYTSIQTATLAGRFNGAEGTAIIWAKVANAGVWTDGQLRALFRFRVDANNQIYIYKSNLNNTLEFTYTAGAVVKQVIQGATSPIDWVCVGLTYSKAADELRAYYGGIQSGLTQNLLGNWAGNLTNSVLGAINLTPLNPFLGYLAHAALWNSALPPAAMLDLVTL